MAREVVAGNEDEEEPILLCLLLIQISLVGSNTMEFEEVSNDPLWRQRMTESDFRALSPLIYLRGNPHGRFSPDVSERLPLEAAC